PHESLKRGHTIPVAGVESAAELAAGEHDHRRIMKIHPAGEELDGIHSLKRLGSEIPASLFGALRIRHRIEHGYESELELRCQVARLGVASHRERHMRGPGID